MIDGDSLEILVGELLNKGFISTAYQPIVETLNHQAHGFEALLRGPKDSPFSEPGGLFSQKSQLGDKMLYRLDMACIGSAIRTASSLPKKPLIFLNILNDTMTELADNMPSLIALLEELDIAKERIVFEISENTPHSCTKDLALSISKFRTHGIKIALDDIGIRSPYLHHILWLEPDYIKLDRSFIQGLDHFSRKQDLVFSTAIMAYKMGAGLIAEGVETPNEYETLKNLGVPYVQGYLFGKAESSEKWGRSVEDGRIRPTQALEHNPDDLSVANAFKHNTNMLISSLFESFKGRFTNGASRIA